MTRPADDVARFALLASAIAGRSVEVAAADTGVPAWTDGTTIFIDPDGDVDDQVRTLAVQASLLAAGSLDAALMAPLVRRALTTRRYLAVEGHRALAARRHVLPVAVWPLIDFAVAGRSLSPADSLAIAMGRQEVPDAPPAFGAVRPKHVVAEAGRTAVETPEGRHEPRGGSGEALRALDEDTAAAAVDLFASPVGGGGAIGRLLKRMLGEGRSPGAGLPGTDPATRGSRRPTRATRNVAVSKAKAIAPLPDAENAFAARPFTYPEWDCVGRRYRPEWCTVIEAAAPRVNPTPLPIPATTRFRRSLARLGTELERRHRQLQGDDVDVDAAVEARVGALAESTVDEAVYIDTIRCRRDLAVLVLLDVSGSAGLPSATGGVVHEHQRAAAAALTAGLFELGDRVALYGFRSQGRSAVHVIPVKRFTDALDSHVLQRLGGLDPGAYTRLGAAIRHGTAVLDREGGTTRRLLVVISDGLAYDHGYERSYGEADSQRALAEARRRGIGCLCLSIGAGSDIDGLRQVFGTAALASTDHLQLLPSIIGASFRTALQSAEIRRRAWQRIERTSERLGLERRAG
jgi:nitric oxide reductase NorD protein